MSLMVFDLMAYDNASDAEANTLAGSAVDRFASDSCPSPGTLLVASAVVAAAVAAS